MAENEILFLGGPRHGDRIPLSDEAKEQIENDGQYIPFTGSVTLPPAWKQSNVYIWNQMEEADFSQGVHERVKV